MPAMGLLFPNRSPSREAPARLPLAGERAVPAPLPPSLRTPQREEAEERNRGFPRTRGQRRRPPDFVGRGSLASPAWFFRGAERETSLLPNCHCGSTWLSRQEGHVAPLPTTA